MKSFGDAPLDMKMSTPRTAGGRGDGHNPEQLFAMGYASVYRPRRLARVRYTH